jgi:hypothetical protein
VLGSIRQFCGLICFPNSHVEILAPIPQKVFGDKVFKEMVKPGMVMHACNHSTLRLKPEDFEFEASLGYLVKSCLKKQTEKPQIIKKRQLS